MSVSPRSLLSLNDDALVQILSRLYGQDALSFSLTSKRASALGLARVGAVIQCSDCSHNLRPLHRFLLAPLCGLPRAHYLESFQLDYDHKAGLEHLVVDILVEAVNLREFRMTRFDVCLSHDPRLGPAMCFIRKLTNLDLGVPNEAVCAILPSLRGSLHSVTLRYLHPYSTQQPEQQSFVSLSAVLSAHRDIHTVHICHFIPQPESIHAGPITATEEPEFHSIRSLRLQACSILALKLVEMCPNLKTLDIEDGLSTPASSEDIIRRALSRSWPPLHRLAFEIHHSTDLLRHIVPHLRPTSILEINDWLSVNGSRPFTHTNSAQFYTHVNSRVPDVTLRGAHDNSSYSTLLRVAAPHALVLRLRLSHVSPAGSPLWGEITARVPQLRALTLELEPDVLLSFELGFYGWPDGILEGLPAALSHTFPKLSSLSLIVRQTRVDRLTWPGYGPQVTWEAAGEREAYRVVALENLAQSLASALPCLQVLSIGDMEPCLTLFKRRSENHDAWISPCPVSQQHWWRVVATTTGGKLERISGEDGHKELSQICSRRS